jgi:hypothetical protein
LIATAWPHFAQNLFPRFIFEPQFGQDSFFVPVSDFTDFPPIGALQYIQKLYSSLTLAPHCLQTTSGIHPIFRSAPIGVRSVWYYRYAFILRGTGFAQDSAMASLVKEGYPESNIQ